MLSIRRSAAAMVVALALTTPSSLRSQTRITSPREEFGAGFGDDYFLATYRQIAGYWHKLARESDRIVIRELGTTAEGRPHLMAIVTSPENHRTLARYQEIARRLATAEGLSEPEARALAAEGKAVVWIDGGLHATEVLGAQQLGEMVYQMVSRTDPETMRFLDDVITLFVHANPDGNDLVADWYMRNPVPEQRSLAQLPRLYQKYIGHDNNREFFTSTQAETKNINRALYRDWFPQILYNHHQSGPAGTVVYSPPLRDPYNFNLDPVLILGLQSLGAAMHTRLAVEGKGGATMRSGGPYDGWWNGGIRNTATFHNTIAVLTEMIGSPTPTRIPFVAQRQIPGGDIALPIAPQVWRFRQSVDYSVSLDRAVLDYASRMRESLLYNIYAMGRASIERGSRDHWTANPRRIAEVNSAFPAPGPGGGTRSATVDSAIWAALRRPELRDPRAFIIPADQPDFPTAAKFATALLETGIAVHRAAAPFTVSGKRYPEHSLVVFAAQAFRPHVMDMFEPQSHPDVFPYPGAPPTPPYDIAGWTLAFQMGVKFDRVFDPFSGPLEKLPYGTLAPPPGRVSTRGGSGGFLLDRRVNNAATAVNRLLARGASVSVTRAPLRMSFRTDSVTWPAGTFYVTGRGIRPALDSFAAQLGVSFEGLGGAARGTLTPLRAPRVGLWDTYGGSMPSGWTRWILEQFEFPFQRVFAPELDRGNLNAKFDVLVFVTGAIPGTTATGRGGPGASDTPPALLPSEYRDHFGRMSANRTIPRIREFLESGGTVLAIGSSAANLAAHLKLPVGNHLVQNGTELPRTSFYVPGSVLAVRVDATHPLAWGMEDRADVFFDESPVFSLGPEAAGAGVTRVAWFDRARPLRSGWAWGQEHLENGAAVVEARIGKGRVVLYGPEILQRAQPHGTFKLLFNGLYEAGSGKR